MKMSAWDRSVFESVLSQPVSWYMNSVTGEAIGGTMVGDALISFNELTSMS